MRRGRPVWIAGLVGVLTAAAAAQPDAAPVGAVPGPFRVFVVADDRVPKENPRNRTGKMHDPVTDAALSPMAAVFARTVPADADAPVAKLVRGLNTIAQKHRASSPTPFVAFLALDKDYPLDETRAEKAAAVKAFADTVKAPLLIYGLSAGKDDLPGKIAAWKIDEADDVVVVVGHRMKVVKRWAFPADKPMTDEDIKAVVDAFEKEAKGGG